MAFACLRTQMGDKRSMAGHPFHCLAGLVRRRQALLAILPLLLGTQILFLHMLTLSSHGLLPV